MALTSRGYRTRTAQRLSDELQNELRNTGREAARRVVQRIRQDTPIRNGHLRKSIAFRTLSRPNGNFEVRFYANTKTAGAARDYAAAVEYGTPSPIRPTKAKALGIGLDQRRLGKPVDVTFRKQVNGQTKQPFFHHNIARFDDIYQSLRRRRGLTGR